MEHIIQEIVQTISNNFEMELKKLMTEGRDINSHDFCHTSLKIILVSRS